jgi:hypothetical protein
MAPYFITLFSKLFGIVVLIGIVLLLITYLQKRTRRSGTSFLVKAKPRFFNGSEQTLFNTLTTITANQPITILAKVKIEELLNPLPNAPLSQRNRYSTMHVDFLLIHSVTSAPILVIEFDGPSHATPKQTERDLKKNELLKTINIPLLRFTSQPSPDQLQQSLSPFIDNLEIKKGCTGASASLST